MFGANAQRNLWYRPPVKPVQALLNVLTATAAKDVRLAYTTSKRGSDSGSLIDVESKEFQQHVAQEEMVLAQRINEGIKQLHELKKEEIAIVEEAITTLRALNDPSSNSLIPELEKALSALKQECLEINLEQPIYDRNAKYHPSILFYAVSVCIFNKTSNHPLIELLIAQKVGLDKQNLDGQTALMRACEKGVLSTVIALVNAGAQLNIKCRSSGMTALDYANKAWGDAARGVGNHVAELNEERVEIVRFLQSKQAKRGQDIPAQASQDDQQPDAKLAPPVPLQSPIFTPPAKILGRIVQQAVEQEHGSEKISECVRRAVLWIKKLDTIKQRENAILVGILEHPFKWAIENYVMPAWYDLEQQYEETNIDAPNCQHLVPQKETGRLQLANLSLLRLATCRRNAGMAQLLVEEGCANVNAGIDVGDAKTCTSALDDAMRCGNRQLAEFLICHSAIICNPKTSFIPFLVAMLLGSGTSVPPGTNLVTLLAQEMSSEKLKDEALTKLLAYGLTALVEQQETLAKETRSYVAGIPKLKPKDREKLQELQNRAVFLYNRAAFLCTVQTFIENRILPATLFRLIFEYGPPLLPRLELCNPLEPLEQFFPWNRRPGLFGRNNAANGVASAPVPAGAIASAELPASVPAPVPAGRRSNF